jgi:DNA replication protein DnaC
MADVVRPCVCKPIRQAERLRDRSGIKESERGIYLDDITLTPKTPDTRVMLEAALDFVKRPYGILTIWGTHGNAKSVVLIAIVNECVRLGLPAVYATFWELDEWVRAGYDEREQMSECGPAWRRFESLCTVPVLAIDEFEKVTDTTYRQALRVNLIDGRYRSGLGTIIAMNRNPVGYLDDAIVSRMRDGRNTFGGHAPIIKNSDPDMRPQMRQE